MATENPARVTRVHLRGDFQKLGERVEPRLPAIFGDPSDKVPMDSLRFARWLVSEGHPLTSRVTVNRAWQQYFGKGLVATTNDFGSHGEPPSHPALLDWLAHRFCEGGWSLKRLHRDLLTSAVYRQSSQKSLPTADRDPPNRWLSRGARFRLPAEVLRDQALAVAGLLVHQLGGPSVFPPQPKGVGEFRDATAGTWLTSEGKHRYRRSLYTFWQRMAPHPAMTTFDAPSREWCTTRRSATNTPLQALAMMNEPSMVAAQDAFATWLERQPAEDRLDAAFRRALARAPDGAERRRWVAFLERQSPENRSRALATVLLNLDEFLTRE